MKFKKCLAGVGAALLIAACDFGGSYSSFYSNSSFELASMYELMSLEECVDSIVYVNQNFYGSTDYAMVFAPATINKGTHQAVKPGFIISMQKDNTLAEGYKRPFSAFSKYGGYQTFAYAVYTDVRGYGESVHGAGFSAYSEGKADLEYFYVNNTNEVVNLVTYGVPEKNIPPFATGDYLKLTLTAHLDGTTKQQEIMLVDFTGSEQKVIKDWEKVTCSGMTGFSYLDFSVSSNRQDVPLNFCLDQLVTHVEIGKK